MEWASIVAEAAVGEGKLSSAYQNVFSKVASPVTGACRVEKPLGVTITERYRH